MFKFFFQNIYKTLLKNIHLSLTKDLYGTLLNFFILFSSILLCVDIFAEFLLNTNSCTICGYPRIPNYSILLLYILNLKHPNKAFKIYIVNTAIFLMLIGFLISMYDTLLIYQIFENKYNCYNSTGTFFYDSIRNGDSRDILYVYKYITNDNTCEFSALMIFSLPFILWESLIFLLAFFITLSTAVVYKKRMYHKHKKKLVTVLVSIILLSLIASFFIILFSISIKFFYIIASFPIL